MSPAAALTVVLVAFGYWIIAVRPKPETLVTLPPPVTVASTAPAALPTPDLLLAQLSGYPVKGIPDPMTAQLEALSLDAQSAARFLLNSLP